MEIVKSKTINNLEYTLSFDTTLHKYFIHSHDKTKDGYKAQRDIELNQIKDKEEALKEFDNL